MIKEDWYKKHFKQIKLKAGARYTPELNVDLPISEIFDGISRTEKFYTSIRENYGELLREFRYVTSKFEDIELQKAYDNIKNEAESLFKIIESIKEYNTVPIPWVDMQKAIKTLTDYLWEFSDQLEKAKEKEKITPPREGEKYQTSPSEKLNYDIHRIYQIRKALHFFEKLSSSTKAQLSNNAFLLLTGSAGTGKTHLLCDVVEQRIQNGTKILPSFLVFGEHFTNKTDFWPQVLEQLGVKNKIKTKKLFLKILDNLGKKTKSRTIFIIDALNENITHSPDFWKNNLDNIIQDIKKYPNIALVVSVRNGFEKEVLTEEQNKSFISEEHNGFRFREWEAVNKFFKAFKLPLPEIPILMPEFQKPLFLLLFCKAFQKRRNNRDKQIFRGHEGATYIFETYIKNVSNPIEKKFGLEHAPNKNIWDTVIEKIAEEMVNQNDDRITEGKLINIINNAHKKVDSAKLIHSLETNMLIVKVPKYEKGERTDGFDIRFPFQKFSDHLIGRFIFKKYENEFGKQNKNFGTAIRFFSKRRKLGKYLSKSWNRGIIEALSIQSPEQLKGIEFIEVAPYLQKDEYLSQVAEQAFVESIIWRNPKAFSAERKNTLNIINKNVRRTETGNNLLLNALLSVAAIPQHPFNADFLNNHLSRFSMSQRDSWWSTFLHYHYGEHGAVDRLIKWSWSDQDFHI